MRRAFSVYRSNMAVPPTLGRTSKFMRRWRARPLSSQQRLVTKSGVAVEKLLAAKLAKIKSRQDALQSIFSGRLDIFCPPNFGCLGRKASFSTPTGDYTKKAPDAGHCGQFESLS